MKITGFIWIEEVVEKLAARHGVTVDEVKQAFDNRPRFKRMNKEILPDNFTTIEELWEFWDTHSSADYETLINLWLQERLNQSA